MKSTLFTTLLLFSFNALACPDLAGEYICPTDFEEDELISITQSFDKGYVVYTVNDEVIPANGTPTKINRKEDGFRIKGVVTARCIEFGNYLTTQIDGRVFLGIAPVAKITGDMNYNLEDGILVVEGEAIIKDYLTQREEPQTVDTRCEPI